MKDEIASKIYVNLSRCEKGHDSCTVFRSVEQPKTIRNIQT